MQHLQQLPVLVLGLGASGLAMARWCARHGAEVTVADTREAPPQLEQLRAELPQVRFVGGPFSAALIEGTPIRAVYRSPGLAPAAIAPVVDAARAIGLPVAGELELFAQALRDLDAQRRAAAVMADEAALAPEAAAEPVETTEPLVADEAPAAPEAPAEAQPTDAPVPAVDAPSAPAAADNTTAYVPHAAREAAAFVAQLAQLSATAPADDAAPAVQPELPIAPPPPSEPTGYTPAVLAVTGTNGKTTVTSLTTQLIESVGQSVAMAGNIGPTLLDTLAARLDAGTLPAVWVLELSSFQLDGLQGFEPTAATVLNLSQDHLDWHGDMDAYAAAKARIFGQHGLMVLNRDDSAVMAMLHPTPAPAAAAKSGRRAAPKATPPRAHITFGADLPTRPGDFGIERVNGMAWLVRAHEADETLKRKRRGAAAQAATEADIHLQRLMPADALRIRGQHNALNALAALALAVSAGCPLAPMLFGLREYRGEPHRVEPIARIGDVEYFDDSKGTNVGATVAALDGLGADHRLVVILGGDGKGQDFAPLAAPVARHARAVVLIGRDATAIEAALSASAAEAGVPLRHAADMDAAVRAAARLARPGDAVLLSPACASLDMFRHYEHRAQAFVAAVQALADDGGPGADEAAETPTAGIAREDA